MYTLSYLDVYCINFFQPIFISPFQRKKLKNIKISILIYKYNVLCVNVNFSILVKNCQKRFAVISLRIESVSVQAVFNSTNYNGPSDNMKVSFYNTSQKWSINRKSILQNQLKENVKTMQFIDFCFPLFPHKCTL